MQPPNHKNIISALIVAAGMLVSGLAQAFVGTIAVGMSEVDENIGRIETPFSADATLETEEMTIDARVYYKPGMVRDEMQVQGQEMVTIRRFDLNKIWMLIGQGMYMESDPGDPGDQAKEYTLVSREVLGHEKVNGIDTTKYKSVYTSEDGKFGGFTWFTDDNIAVKGFLVSETKGDKQRIKYEFKNLNRGPQPDNLFEVPAGYRQFNMGGLAGMGASGSMKQMQQMPQIKDMAGMGQAPAQQPGSAQAAPSQPAQEQPADEDRDPSFVEDVAKDTQEEVKRSTNEGIVDGVGEGVRDGIRKGFGKLFGR